MRQGKIDFKPETVNIGEIIRKTTAMMEPMMQEKNVRVFYPRSMSLMLHVDVRMIKEVFANLLSNAVKFVPETG